MSLSLKISLISITIFLFFLQLSLVFAFSNANIGNSSFNIGEKYGASQSLNGWINISLNNEDFNSFISVSYSPASSTSSIGIYDLIKKSSIINYSCSIFDCNFTFIANGSASSSFSSIFDMNETRLLGFKITESSVDNIEGIKLNLTSKAVESCQSPLNIDIGNDGIIDWQSGIPASDLSTCYESYGCYTPSTLTTLLPLNTQYCETINVSSASMIFVGADLSRVSGNGETNFRFSVEDKSCTNSTSVSGKVGCYINRTITEPSSLEVCLSQVSGIANSFALYRETNSPVCGSDDNDFSIFLRSVKYGSPGNILMSSSELNGIAMDYLQQKYNSLCSKDCYIPVKIFSSQAGQEISMNNVELIYRRGTIITPLNSFYNLSSAPSKISMPFSKLYLNASGLLAPNVSGFYNLSLKFNGNLVFKKQIEVLNLPVINSLSPLEIPAALNTLISVSASSNITEYTWNFGDNTTAATNSSSVMHKYSNVGRYTILVSAKNSQGTSSKNFSINVTSPKDYLNSTIIDYKNKVAKLKSQINGFPALAKSYIDGKFNLTDLEIQLTSLQVQYNNVGNDSQKYIQIANSLQAISIPISINVSEKSSGQFIADLGVIHPQDLIALTSDNVSASDEAIKNATFSWMLESLDISGSSQVYSANINGISVPLMSYISLSLSPLKELGEAYFIINEPRDKIFTSLSSISYLSNSAGITLDLASGKKDIDFLILDSVNFLDLPIYVSPRPSELNILGSFGNCNFNAICEAGEDSVDCRSDCKPWNRAILWIILAMFFVFCIYIAAQEWYKRHYESSLFKDENDLYNLTHFIDNAEKQGLIKNDIFNRLSEKSWPNEQIGYAYKKYKGLRTGMWEIPIFKFLENKKVNQQIEIRRNMGINPNVAPRPIKPFLRPNQLAVRNPANNPNMPPKMF